MADTDIKFRVSQTGAEKTAQDFKKVDNSVNQMESGSIKATKGLGSLGTVGRQVGTSLASSAGLNGGIARVIGSFMGGGGLVFALTAVGIGLYKLIEDSNKASKAFDDFVKSIDGAIKKLIQFQDPLKGVKFGISPEQLAPMISALDKQIQGLEEANKVILNAAGVPNVYGVNTGALLNQLGVLKGLSTEQQKQLKVNEKLRDVLEDQKISIEAQQMIAKTLGDLGVKELETEKEKTKEIRNRLRLYDATQRKLLGLIAGEAGTVGSRGFDATRVITKGGASGAMISKELQDQMSQTQDLIAVTAGVLREEFTQAWEDVFGEANSLFEKFAMRIAEYFTELALRQAAMGLFNLIFPGAGTIVGAASKAGSSPASPGMGIYLDGDKFGEFVDRRVPYSVNRAVRLDIL